MCFYVPVRSLAQLVGSPVRDPAYADPPAPADWGSKVVKNINRGSPFKGDINSCRNCKGACVGDLLSLDKFNLGQGP